MHQAGLDEVTLMLASGAGEAAIVRSAQERLGLPAGQAAELVAEAKRRIAAAAVGDRPGEIGKTLVRLDALYRRAFAAGDWRTAGKALSEATRLRGLGPGDVAGAAVGEAVEVMRAFTGPAYCCDFEGQAKPPGWRQAECPCPYCRALRWLAAWAPSDGDGARAGEPVRPKAP